MLPLQIPKISFQQKMLLHRLEKLCWLGVPNILGHLTESLKYI